MGKSYQYKIELKQDMLDAINKLAPNSFKGGVVWRDCPSCSQKESLFYISEYKYGRCQECMYEEGFEYYQVVMADREREYEKIKNAIIDALKLI